MNIEESELPHATSLPLGLTDRQFSGEETPLFCLNRIFFSNIIHQEGMFTGDYVQMLFKTL